jgi:hypothetical protein
MTFPELHSEIYQLIESLIRKSSGTPEAKAINSCAVSIEGLMLHYEKTHQSKLHLHPDVTK